MKDRKKRNTLLLLLAILLFAGIFYAAYRYTHRGPSAYVQVSVNGKLYERYDLNQDREEIIVSAYGNNHLIIKDGEAWIEDASCPDKICIYTGKIHEPGSLVVCLPNRMIAEIVRAEDVSN